MCNPSIDPLPHVNYKADWSSLPTLGVGIGYRSELWPDIVANPSSVDFLELIAEHFVSLNTRDRLRMLRENYPLIPHGIDLSLGTAEPLNPDVLHAYRELIEAARSPWWSEHLSFTRAGGVEIGHLTPLPMTQDAIEVMTHHIGDAQEIIPHPFLLENIAYLAAWPDAEYREGEFIAAIAEGSDCGLLLDLANLYANHRNGFVDWETFLSDIPLDRVIQIHLGGGRDVQGKWVDTHDRPVSPETWHLLEQALPRLSNLKAISLEWDHHFPSFGIIRQDIERIRSLWPAAHGSLTCHHS